VKGTGGTRAVLLTARTFALCALCAAPASGQQVTTGVQPEDPLHRASEDFTAGRYEEAIRLYRSETGREDAYPQAQIGLAGVLSEVGRYEEAETALREAISGHPGSFELHNSLGEVLIRTGDLDGAEEAFRLSISGLAGDHLTAELNLAELIFRKGDRAEALARFDRFIDVYNNNPDLDCEELTAVGRACVYLGRLNPDLFRDALRAFDEARESDPRNLEPALRTGFLFLEKYNSADAGETFDEILSINPSNPRALLGKARQLHFDGSLSSFEMVGRALDVNPNLLEARAFLGELLLGVEAFHSAAGEAEKALEINPNFQPALYVLASAEFLKSDEVAFREIEERVLGLNPLDGEFYLKVAQA